MAESRRIAPALSVVFAADAHEPGQPSTRNTSHSVFSRKEQRLENPRVVVHHIQLKILTRLAWSWLNFPLTLSPIFSKTTLMCVTLVFLLANGTSAFAQDGVSTIETVENNEQAEDNSEKAALRRFLEATIAESAGFDDRFAAEVWLVDMSARLTPFVPDIDARLTLLRQIHAAAVRSELSAELVLAVIEVESAFDRFAVSRAGAQGLMQVMPFWRREIGRPDDNLTDNETNLSYGCRILQFYLQRENGALHRALAAYNGSSGSRRYSNKVQAAWKARWKNDPLEWER